MRRKLLDNITIERKGYYIFNDKGVLIKDLTIDELFDKLDCICEEGYVGIGMEYQRDDYKLPECVDYIIRKNTGDDFIMSNDVEKSERAEELKKLLMPLDVLLLKLNIK